ncbi:hypothetical protein D8I24_6504 [Cupriavidus necator H850]|nr:hypothetical protein [Cupriavidus necator]KAI3597688.1 hypothetical protein D8I24_6504 [Cupriavidus necator H850]
MNKRTRIKGWLTYLALVFAVYVAHACAVEFDEQVVPATASARQV